MTFESLTLHPALCKSVAESGYKTPTLIQERAIPVALEGKDVLASAQTGTGKTAAFILPVLQRLATPSAVTKSRGPRMLVLTPTRELALQVSDCARKYGKFLPSLAVVSIVGGVPYQKQRAKMNRPVDIMVATPGRLMDYMRQGSLDLRRIEVLILDEADRMLDMGFRDDVLAIAEALPQPRQTMLFSATIDATIEKIARQLLREPVRIEITPQRAKHESIDQKLHYVKDLPAKKQLLVKLLGDHSVGQAIIFTATKRSADQLCYQLRDRDFAVAALHGDLRQRQRTRTIGEFQEGELQILVATDIAARGIDVRSVSHIFNFDLPRASEDYVHRIGRTGRAGEKGTAVSIAYFSERHQVRKIESFVGHPIEIVKLEGFSSDAPPAHEHRESKDKNRGNSRRDKRGFHGGNSRRRHGQSKRFGRSRHGQKRADFRQPSVSA